MVFRFFIFYALEKEIRKKSIGVKKCNVTEDSSEDSPSFELILVS